MKNDFYSKKFFETCKGKIFKHFKGDLYILVDIAEHTESGEDLVIYRTLYGSCKLYARPLSMFAEKVDKDKYPYVEQEYRFELMEIESVAKELNNFKKEINAAIDKYGLNHIDIIQKEDGSIYGNYHSLTNSFAVTNEYKVNLSKKELLKYCESIDVSLIEE